jgi:hypothetical protein
MKSINESEWFDSPLLTKVQANPLLGDQGNDFNLAVDLAVDVNLPQAKDEGKK